MVKVILWDWDNTLVDTFNAVLSAQNDTRTHFGLPAWSREDAKQAMNKSGRDLLNTMFGELKMKEARDYYLNAYLKYTQNNDVQLKPNAIDVLKLSKEKGFYNILASNKASSILKDELTCLKIDGFFDRVCAAEDINCDKPSKQFTDEALKGLDVDLLIAVGDGRSDVQMARNYDEGIAVLIGTNPHTKEFEENFEKVKPDLYFTDFKAVLNLLSTNS